MFLESVRKLKTPGNMTSNQADNSSGSSKGNVESKLPSSEVAHLGTLEKRLAELEGLVGISVHDEVQSLTQEGSVLDTLYNLEDKVRLLAQPRHLESLSRRAKMLTQEFEKLTAARASRGNQEGIDDEVLDKVNRLFDMVQRVEPLIETTPAIIARLQSLQSVHLEATLVSQTLRQCSDEQTSISEELKVLQEISERLQSSIVENTSTIEENVQNLDERIKSLHQRIDKLVL
ncbi:hypothetical protein IWQ61_008497 [Dispira simplex]|nr:hypothetical protein IWQ61_008497 [Dispira simplex]